ncbi:FecCD family ABC transporter permease [Methanimicrococcus blatticola]|uniref:Cobalamin import system permease protein BtuC n=1 Tax=Methanimicrococcus blatticola TaxID=91560 RepID=A0A484F6J3_9EURY|nr:iron ABC transporter permease [Methanimicrococcus blatticola]MBZ3936142.1 iron ABC transporter permease [Methanimicrococcus blatticola]MCC2508385.1 iron ABC transporter permease [Methanimicrococcus blatticola]TDQ70162.1 iron complex transport system permease protein [Methanimicrococcus blatticola]
MHLEDGTKPAAYKKYIAKKIGIIGGMFIFLIFFALFAVSVGAVNIPIPDVIKTLIGGSGTGLYERIIWNIRIPQILTAIIAGIGLAIAGVSMQSILRNPLASPYTLGLSNAAALGAAVGISLFGFGTTGSNITDAVIMENPYLVTICAFVFSMLTSGIILIIAKIKSATPEVMVLAGVAINSLAAAGLMAIQYFVDDTKLASIVFWQFGDVARAGWSELIIIGAVVLICSVYFIWKRWDFNAIDAGDETAKSLGVNVSRVRLVGMIAASLISAVIVSFLGVIGFVGLVCPHMMRRLIGDDQRFLIIGTAICGALLLLISDTIARTLIAPHVLPVAVITAFLGAPVFLYLIVRGH